MVTVGETDGRLRLRWSGRDAEGRPKRFSLAVGAVNQANRHLAERLARQIELDIASANFDASLRKYKGQTDRVDALSVRALCDRFIQSEFNPTQSSTIERHLVLRNHLMRCFGEIEAVSIQERQVQKFCDFLQSKKLKAETINLYLCLLRAIWAWAIKRSLLLVNPWELEALSVPVEPRQRPRPFTREEIRKIIEGFQGSPYEDLVRFLLGSGCRIGEAIALSWDAIAADNSEVWFGKSWDTKAKAIKTTKTNKARTVPLSPATQALLAHRRAEHKNPNPSPLVFPSPTGGVIDRRNFLRRHWKPLLERLEIPYRPPYNSRHTRWSHEIASGMDIATAAQYAGNSPRTMLNRYYGAIDRPRLKDWE